MAKKMITIGKGRVSVAKFKEFLHELREGTHQQERFTLQGAIGFCCLGVGCNLFSKKHPRSNKTSDGRQFLVGNMPGLQYHDPRWLIDLDADLVKKVGIGAVSMNDGNGVEQMTHPEIADLLQAVYIEGVMDDGK
jgi:glutaredoxin-related protein